MMGKYRDIEDDDAMVYGRRAAASRVRGCARQGTTVGTPGCELENLESGAEDRISGRSPVHR